MAKNIWLRVKLPASDSMSLQARFSECNFLQGDDQSFTADQIRAIDVIFTEEAIPESFVQSLTGLQWLHVTRGGVNAYLTPTVKARPIQVTGSKGIHGTVFSEFALACILMFAKRLPECIAAQRENKWQRLAPFEVEG